ncbi:bacterio-opsin activator domain-containing protein [Halorubrum sp. CSM-61]|uniref:bacterio-opsin activator domain-containing protein n=1 Tax=Halorubrum sp. CSM-61 TaxID=2485838 RepID=UPI000F4C7F10|nr:bacterio-opsin activator domain-containing protein [Halorubrum sp. CSM-61]
MDNGGNAAFVELEFSSDDDDYPAVRISRELDCRLDLLDAIRIDNDLAAAFFHVEHGTPQRVIEEARKSHYENEITVVERFDDECILKFVLRRSVFETLSDLQIPLQSLVVSDGTARFVTTVPPNYSPARIVSAVKTRHPRVSLVRKQKRIIAAPFLTQTAFQSLVDEQLTGQQLDAVHLAFEYGYFERPRETTQAALAAKMDISPSTYGQHLHSALRKLLAALFNGNSTHYLPAGRDE